jgi:hypothetical protein
MEDDRSIADPPVTIAEQHRQQIADKTLPDNQTRLEIIRKLELITQSVCLRNFFGLGFDHTPQPITVSYDLLIRE